MRPSSIGLLILGGGLLLAVAAWLVDRRRRAYTDLATTPAAAVFAGRNEVKGRAWVERPTLSHRTRTPCVWWDYTLEEERNHTRTVTSTDSNGNRRTRTETYQQWHQIEHQADSCAFEVVDSTGSVPVRGGGKVVPRQVLRDTFRDDDRGGDRGLLRQLFDSRTGRYRETEEVVAAGDHVFVVGEASLDRSTDVPVITPTLVSTRSEESHSGRLGAAVALLVILAVGGVGAGTTLAIGGDEPGGAAFALGAAVPLLGLALAWLATTYNRLRLLAQSIDRAWSLVDVQLRRRYDLIPALNDVVVATAGHERAVLELASRWNPGEATTGADLSAQAATQTHALTAVLGRAEALPTLTSDEAFLRLQRALADTESRIAGSRMFFNDTLTLLRTRAQSFPHSLVARWLHLQHRDHIPAEGFERTVPAVEHTFA